MKKFLSFILAVMMMTTMAISISAAVIDPGDIAEPCLDYMNYFQVNLRFTETTGTAYSTIHRTYGVTTLLEGTLTVYKKVGVRWVEIDSVSGSSTRTLSLELDFDAVIGTTYKAEVVVTAYGSDGSETVSDFVTAILSQSDI